MRIFTVALGLGSGLLAGCGAGGGTTVPLVYTRPAHLPLPQTVKTLGVVPWSDMSDLTSGQWSGVVTDEMVRVLAERSGSRTVYGPKRMGRALAGGDFIEPLGPDSARRLGRLVGVDAVLYGSMDVAVSRTATNSPVDPEKAARPRSNDRAGSVHCRVRVSFSLDEVSTGRSIGVVSLTKARSVRSGGARSGDDVVRSLLHQCVKEFVEMINPKHVDFSVALEIGAGKMMRQGNGLARDGKYDQALACYAAALGEDGSDAGAAFNAGLMYEVTRRYDEAASMYDKAFRLTPLDKYALARGRVLGPGGE